MLPHYHRIRSNTYHTPPSKHWQIPISTRYELKDMGEGDTFPNALIGAVITVVTVSLLPFSPIFGGAVSGYLQGGDGQDGLKVGALSGLLALIPVLVVLALVGNILLILFAGTSAGSPGLAGGLGFLFLSMLVAIGVLYIVLLSAVGGWVGQYLKTELDGEAPPSQERQGWEDELTEREDKVAERERNS